MSAPRSAVRSAPTTAPRVAPIRAPTIAPRIAIIAAAPAPLLARLVADCASLGSCEQWTPNAAPPWLARAPGPLGPFARRRIVGDIAGDGAPRPSLSRGLLSPGLLADAALHAWAGERTDRRYLAELAKRVALDAWAAARVRRHRPQIVVATSLGARRTFAAARAVGARTVLVLDLPLLRALHRDLDRAARVWPHRAFLRRFRAPSWAIARQEAERVLADVILVRGPYARSLCLADGIPAERLAELPRGAGPQLASSATPTGRLRLAGLAAARHGVDTALAAAQRLGKTLVVRIGEGTEPADLARLPGVATDDGPVDAIVCPAICEAYPPEVRASGLPVIASPMASLDGRGPDPYDAEAFARAIEAARPQVASQAPSVAPRIAQLL